MDSFSIWHWLIVLVFLFIPIGMGFLLMGLQKAVKIKHGASGLVKNGYVGFSWTYLMFGWLVPVIRGEVGIGVLHLILTAFTFGLFQPIMAFLYNRQYMTRMLTNGWALADEEETNAKARLILGIAEI